VWYKRLWGVGREIVWREIIWDGEEWGLGLKHSDTMVSMFNIASACLEAENYAKARELLLDVRDVWQESFGEDHPWLALCYNSLGKAEAGTGNPKLGLELCSKALNILQSKMGNDHPWSEIAQTNVDNITDILKQNEDITSPDVYS